MTEHTERVGLQERRLKQQLKIINLIGVFLLKISASELSSDFEPS